MKDKIIEIENGLEYYVLDELMDKNDNYYIFCVQTDDEKELIYENYIICQVTTDLNGNSFIEKVSNNVIYEKICNKFIERLKNN